MSASELKRCPFCGGEEELTHSQYGTVNATCKSCFATTMSAIEDEEAIAAWNRRAGEGEK